MVRRVTVLAGLLAALLLLSVLLLREVVGTIFFAVTVAYVLYPIRERLATYGMGPKVAAGVSTALAFMAAALLLTPLVIVLYIRRNDLISFIRGLPAQFPVEFGGMTYQIELTSLSERAVSTVSDTALGIASAAPALAFKLFLFVLLVYALLLRPTDVSRALLRPVPREYHDVVMALHERLRSTLYAVYVLQAATAVGTFVIALVVFELLGYKASFSLAVISGVLQFIPILGPSIVILALAGFELVAEHPDKAILVAVLGLFFIGFLPDAVIRPQLASLTGGMPGSLYFIGFTGGILSIGVVGVIAGPVLVGLLVEAGELLASERHSGPVMD